MLTAAGTAGLDALAVPSPALFAGLIVGHRARVAGRAPARVSRRLSLLAQAVIGVVIGVLAQPETLTAVAADWLPVLLVELRHARASAWGPGCCSACRPGVSPLTGMLALTAGGASGLVAVTRELGGDDRVVAVVQYLRVGLVTVSMPVVAAMVFGASGDGGRGPGHRAVRRGTSGSAAWWCAPPSASRWPASLRVPAGGLLGPMAVALALNLAGWSFGAAPPTLLVEVAYAVIGWQAGVRFTRESLRMVVGVLPMAVGTDRRRVGAVRRPRAAADRASPARRRWRATSRPRPAAIYAVLATAVSSGADVAFVVAVQVLRVIVMLLVAPALARWVAGRQRGGA